MKGSPTALLRITGIRPLQRSEKRPSEEIGQALRLIRWPINRDALRSREPQRYVVGQSLTTMSEIHREQERSRDPVDFTASSTLPKAEGSKRSRRGRCGGDGGLIWQSANGGPSAKTTAPMGKLGHSFRSSMRIVAPIVGERMASRDSATRLRVGAWAWRFGMARTRF